MKNILVPTDFSACASNATDVAVALAEFFGAKLHLYSCLDIHPSWKEFSEEKRKEYPEDAQKIHNAEVLFDEWEAKAAERDVVLTTSWSGGYLVKNLQKMVADDGVDFIVMGSHGASGKTEYLIGSNTQKVVQKVNCPVFVNKGPLKKFQFKNVIFASDFDPKEKETFQYALDILAPFNPTFHLVEINTSSWFNQPYVLVKELMNDFSAMCPPLVCKKYFYRDYSVEAGIRHFAEEINADLIIISNYQKHPVRGFFQGSNVESLVNHAELPVLCIDFQNKPNDEENTFSDRFFSNS